MARARRLRPEQEAISEVRKRLDVLMDLLPTLTRHSATATMAELVSIMAEIEAARSALDPIKEPGASLDPSEPETAGRFVALALMAQEKIPLARIAKTYGSGVYAIYYHGDHPAYRSVSRTETPIYVGKADPQTAKARTSREQGPQLYNRLADHRRMIKTVGKYAEEQGLPHPLRIEDFSCRRLVCATNAQLVAERHLIEMFNPIWNNDGKICWGISKHGDAAKTRANKRSPWDVMHPGRIWAMHESLEDKMSPEEITTRIAEHFEKHPPYRSRVRVIHEFLATFVQNAAMTPEELSEAEDTLAEAIEQFSEGGDMEADGAQ